jgi:hypothetical protein
LIHEPGEVVHVDVVLQGAERDRDPVDGAGPAPRVIVRPSTTDVSYKMA